LALTAFSHLGIFSMWMYLAVFATAVFVDSIPIFAPPAWTVLVFFLVRYDLNTWAVVLIGVTGCTLGRYLLSLYVPYLTSRVLNRYGDNNLDYIGQRIGQSVWSTYVFIFLYSLTPLSTTALFTAAASAKLKAMHMLPPFFLGKLLSYSFLIYTGQYAAQSVWEMFQGQMSVKGILSLLFGLVIIVGLFFVDWRQLFEHKKLRFNFRIWKGMKAKPA
jgi:membrane protein YqaA with SNARE-associated domain